MSALTATSGEPQSVGDPGQVPPTEFLELIGETVQSVRALALYQMLLQRIQRDVTVAPPAVGANFTVTVPANALWEVLSVSFRLVASAVVATRTPGVVASNVGALQVGVGVSAAGQGAGTTVNWTFQPFAGYGAVTTVTGGFAGFGFPPLPAGSTVASLVNLIDVGDQISNVVVTVREWTVGQVYWAADLIGRELGFEHLTDLPANTPLPEGTGQPIPVVPLAR